MTQEIYLDDLSKALTMVYHKRRSWERTQIDRAARAYLSEHRKVSDEQREEALDALMELEAINYDFGNKDALKIPVREDEIERRYVLRKTIRNLLSPQTKEG